MQLKLLLNHVGKEWGKSEITLQTACLFRQAIGPHQCSGHWSKSMEKSSFIYTTYLGDQRSQKKMGGTYYRKRGSASYIVREVREVKERERERERKTEVTSPFSRSNWRWVLHFSLPKICTLVSPLLNGAEFTLSVAKNVALFETVPVLRKIRTVKWRHTLAKLPRQKLSNYQVCNRFYLLLLFQIVWNPPMKPDHSREDIDRWRFVSYCKVGWPGRSLKVCYWQAVGLLDQGIARTAIARDLKWSTTKS